MNDRSRRFCEEYLIDLNATQAALRAGYKPATARDASEWINRAHPQKPELRREIDRQMAERARRTGISAERVVRELARLGFADLLKIVNPDTGELLPGISEDDSVAIASVIRRTGYNTTEVEVRLADKLRALELLGKHLGIFNENINILEMRPVVIVDDVKPE